MNALLKSPLRRLLLAIMPFLLSNANAQQLSATGIDRFKADYYSSYAIASNDKVIKHKGRTYFAMPSVGEKEQVFAVNDTVDGVKQISNLPYSEFDEVVMLHSSEKGLLIYTSLSCDGVNSKSLWIFNEQLGKTSKLVTLSSGDADLKQALSNKGKTYFIIGDSGTSELWVTNGEMKGTYRIQDLGGYSDRMMPAGEGILFTAPDGTWFTDGIFSNTRRVSAAHYLYDQQPPYQSYASIGAYVYFFTYAYDEINIARLTAYNSKTGQLRFIHNLDGAIPARIISDGTYIYFATITGHGYEYTSCMWKSDGSPMGTHVIFDLPIESISSGELHIINNQLLFIYSLNFMDSIAIGFDESGWNSQNPLPYHASSSTIVNDIMYCVGCGENRDKVYSFDGFTLREFMNGSADGVSGPINYFSSQGDYILFTALDKDNEYSLFARDVNNKTFSQKIFSYAYFYRFDIKGANDGVAYASIYKVESHTVKYYKTDGTTPGTLGVSAASVPLFQAPSDVYGRIIRATETGNIIDIIRLDDPATIIASIAESEYYHNRQADDEDYVYGKRIKDQLYIYKYFHASRKLKQLVKISLPKNIPYEELITSSIGNRVFFATPLDSCQYQIWSCTDSGNDLVCHSHATDQPHYLPTMAQEYHKLNIFYKNSHWYFPAYSSANGLEMWMTDGTMKGTRIFQDIVTGERGSEPRSITLDGDKMFFVGNANTMNTEEIYCIDFGTGFDKDLFLTGTLKSFTNVITEQKLTLTNRGNVKYRGIELLSDDSSFSAKPSRFDLKPGQSQEIFIQFNPSRIGPIQGVITLLANESAAKELEIMGTYDVQPDDFHFNGMCGHNLRILGRSGITFQYIPPAWTRLKVASLSLMRSRGNPLDFENHGTEVLESANGNEALSWIPTENGIQQIDVYITFSDGYSSFISIMLDVTGVGDDSEVSGKYEGLIYASDGDYSCNGFASINANGKEGLSGVIQIGSETRRVKGKFSAAGVFRSSYSSAAGKTELTILRSEGEDYSSIRLMACHTGRSKANGPTGKTVQISGELHPVISMDARSNFQRYVRSYVCVIDPGNFHLGLRYNISGYGFGNFVLGSDLVCRLRGTFANGERWTRTASLTNSKTLPLFTVTKRRSVFSSPLQFDAPTRLGGDGGAAVQWFVAPTSNSPDKSQAYYIPTEMTFAATTEAPKDDNILGVGESPISYIANNYEASSTIDQNNRISRVPDDDGSRINCRIDPRGGLIRGETYSGYTKVYEEVQGIYYPPSNKFYGFAKSGVVYGLFECGP
jgi:ELWxxDGT repeat protein